MYTDFEQLRADCMNCKKCRLGDTRTNLVFGVGNPNAKIMFIGEGPGEQEDLQGEPFVGRSGQLLDKADHPPEDDCLPRPRGRLPAH